MDKSSVEPTIFFIEKISFSLKLFSGHFYGQSSIKTVRGPLHFLQAINSNYTCFGICDHDLDNPSNRKVSKGGVAILWHRSLDNQVTPLDIDSDRICGIQFRISRQWHFYILQVYAPSSNHPIQTY